MPSYTARGIVLKKTKLGETDLIVTLLSDSGSQIRAVAKGARKPGASASRLELLSVVEGLFSCGRSLDIISEVRLVEPHTACRADPGRLTAAAALCEFLEAATREADAEPRLFPMTKEALRCLGSVVFEGIEVVLAAALFECAGQIGYLPALDECAQCGTPLELPGEQDGEALSALDASCMWSVEEGGLLCQVCADASAAEATSLNPALVGWLRMCLGARFVEIEASLADCSKGSNGQEIAGDIKALHSVGVVLLGLAEEWIAAHLGITLKSSVFLRDFLSK